MYNPFFEFEENPFSPKPDLAFFYRSKQHDASVRSLMFAVQARMGLSSLTGEEGTGKTMVIECLRDTLESTQTQCAVLRDSRISTSRFFQTIASELDLKCQGTSAYQVFSALHQFTLQQSRKGRTVALIVDDAHNLPADVLNEILHLASLHDDKVKLLQTVLAGRPQLLPTLDTLNLERLKQHAILSCHLDPFTAQETREYIEFRLAQAGLPDQTIFPPDAISEIHDRSRGFAPAIHAICEGLLLAAFSAGSKVCTEEILDQVFNRTRREEPGVVAIGSIDLARLPAPSEPEPAFLTALLGLACSAIKSMPPPLAVNANELVEPRRVALRLMFPKRKLTIPVGEFAWGSKQPMQPTGGANDVSSVIRYVRPEVHAIPSVSTVSRPVLSKPVVWAELRPESKLQRIRPNRLALLSSPSAVLATPIDFPSVALQPVNSDIESLKAATALLTPKGVNKLSRLSCTVQPASGNLSQVAAQSSAIDVPSTLGPIHPAANFQPAGANWRRTSLVRLPARFELPANATGSHRVSPTATQFTRSLLCHPGIPAGEACQAIAPRISKKLFPLACSVEPRPVAAGAPAGAHSFSLASSLPPAQPAATLQPAGTIQLPRVPLAPFGIALCDPPLPKITGDFQVHLNLQNPVGPRMGTDLTAFGESNVPERSHLLSLACNVPPSAPAVGTPIKKFVKPVQSLQPYGPVSKLEPVNPRSSWLLLPSWKPVDTNPVIALETVLSETKKPTSFHPKWLLTLVTPILAAIALYGLSPAVLPAADALNQSWRRAHQAVLDRAAVALRDDFRTGLDDWMNRGGARPSWTSDAAGFVHPGALALYRPSLGMADYQMQFVGMIDKKALSWVVRAADFNNYYAVRLSVLKPGPVPSIGVTRYAVINGKIQDQVTTPLLMSARSDTIYRVSLDVRGDHFALAVQDQPVDSWSEPKLPHGAIGFFSEQDAGSRVAAVQVKGQYDMLGRLCAFLAPSAVASYRASLNERAALTVTPEMQASSGGRGGPYSSSPSHAGRLPGARLDPAFWQVPEVNLPNARRCSPPASRIGVVRTRHTLPYSGASTSTACY
jgi:general secretion pathway protein A